MKIKSLLYISLVASLLFASCNLNEQPVFDDATQAFIAFDATSGRVNEAVDGVPDTLDVKLYCASVAGITASVKVVATDTAYDESIAAKEGVDFKIISDTEFHFDAANRFATVRIVTIDNDVQGGDHRFDLVLTDVQGCNLGANKRFAVTISDDEDPVNMLVGTYAASAESAFTDYPTQTWTATVTKDDETDNKIWISPICEFGGLPASSIYPVYGIVDVSKNTITIPYGQTVYGSESSTYNMVIAGLASNPVLSGSMMANIDISGTDVSFTINSSFGVGNTNADEWWYQALMSPIVFTKQ